MSNGPVILGGGGRFGTRKSPSPAPAFQVQGRGVLAALTPGERIMLTKKIGEAVTASFAVDQIRVGTRPIVKTQAEVKRRAAMCLQIFADLAADRGFGIKRAMNQLAIALRKKLDTIPFEPDSKRKLYKATTLDDLIVPG